MASNVLSPESAGDELINVESPIPVAEMSSKNNHNLIQKQSTTVDSIRKQSGGIPFYAVPKQRQHWGDTHFLPHVNWGDLFFDLFFVAACYRLGNLLKSDCVTGAGFRGFAYYVGLFGPIISVWKAKLMYDCRFELVDHAHRVYEMIRLFFLAFAILHIKSIAKLSDESSPVSLCFSIGIFGESCMVMLKYVEVYFKGKGSKGKESDAIKPTAVFIVIYSEGVRFISSLTAVIVSAVFYVKENSEGHKKDQDHYRVLASNAIDPSVWVRGDFPIMILLVGFIVSLTIMQIRIYCAPPFEITKKTSIPMNLDFVIHRHGEWILLMLGESILSLLIVEVKESTQYYVVFFFGVATVILIQHLHFQSQPSHAADHAMRRSRASGIAYSVAFDIYSMALVALGASFKIMLYNSGGTDENDAGISSSDSHRYLASSSGTESKTETAHLFCRSLFIVLVCFDFISLMHKGINQNVSRCKSGKCRMSKRRHNAAIIMVLCKVALYIFTVTLSLWTEEPGTLAIASSIIALSMIIMSDWGFSLFAVASVGDSSDV